MVAWHGIDDGREAFLDASLWFEVLETLWAHQGENHTDLNSPVFTDLAARMPGVAWISEDGTRSFFRGFSKAWTLPGVLRPTAETDGYIELTSLGQAVVLGELSLTEFFRSFVDHYVEYMPVGETHVGVSPFLLIAGFLRAGGTWTVDDLRSKVEASALSQLPAGEAFLTRPVDKRHFRNYLQILVNAGAIDDHKGQFSVTDEALFAQLWASGGQTDESDEVLPSSTVAEDIPIDYDEDLRKAVVGQQIRREGQGKFKKALISAYGGACVVSGASESRVLEGAHIMPYMGRHTNSVNNGLLLAVDLHRLFDALLMSIDPDTLTVRFHPSLSDNRYRQYEGADIAAPLNPDDGPDLRGLRQHFERFLKHERT